MNITIKIERLIFDGIAIPQRQRAIVQSSCEDELTRLLAANGLSLDLQTSGMQKTMRGGSLEVMSDETPQVLGRKLAQAIYRGIGQ
jgi:hypothetical protein